MDGIYSDFCSEEVKLCSLAVIGVNNQGEKKFLTIEAGVLRVYAELARGVAGS